MQIFSENWINSTCNDHLTENFHGKPIVKNDPEQTHEHYDVHDGVMEKIPLQVSRFPNEFRTHKTDRVHMRNFPDHNTNVLFEMDRGAAISRNSRSIFTPGYSWAVNCGFFGFFSSVFLKKNHFSIEAPMNRSRFVYGHFGHWKHCKLVKN